MLSMIVLFLSYRREVAAEKAARADRPAPVREEAAPLRIAA